MPHVRREKRESKERKLRTLHWVHAGILKDVQSITREAYYAFVRWRIPWGPRKGHWVWKIVYAADKWGTSFGNYNVGQIKRNLITFDTDLSKHWKDFLTEWGTWKKGKAMAGRAQQRMSLLRIYLQYQGPRTGRARVMGPPLNVHHAPDHLQGDGVRVHQPVRNGRCYPGTRITLSTCGIRIDAWRDTGISSALKVIDEFLNGEMFAAMAFQVDWEKTLRERVESAFFELGWRIDRAALEKAMKDKRHRVVEKLYQSQDWIDNPPLMIDRYKGMVLKNILSRKGVPIREAPEGPENSIDLDPQLNDNDEDVEDVYDPMNKDEFNYSDIENADENKEEDEEDEGDEDDSFGEGGFNDTGSDDNWDKYGGDNGIPLGFSRKLSGGGPTGCGSGTNGRKVVQTSGDSDVEMSDEVVDEVFLDMHNSQESAVIHGEFDSQKYAVERSKRVSRDLSKSANESYHKPPVAGPSNRCSLIDDDDSKLPIQRTPPQTRAPPIFKNLRAMHLNHMRGTGSPPELKEAEEGHLERTKSDPDNVLDIGECARIPKQEEQKMQDLKGKGKETAGSKSENLDDVVIVKYEPVCITIKDEPDEPIVILDDEEEALRQAALGRGIGTNENPFILD